MVHEGGLLFNSQLRALSWHRTPWPARCPISATPARRSSKDFEDIVLGGSRASAGMPSFKNILNAEQVQAIQAYIVSRARESAKPAESQRKQ